MNAELTCFSINALDKTLELNTLNTGEDPDSTIYTMLAELCGVESPDDLNTEYMLAMKKPWQFEDGTTGFVVPVIIYGNETPVVEEPSSFRGVSIAGRRSDLLATPAFIACAMASTVGQELELVDIEYSEAELMRNIDFAHNLSVVHPAPAESELAEAESDNDDEDDEHGVDSLVGSNSTENE